MSGELTGRVVRDDNARRVSVYLRSDGKYEYAEEVVSEWDDSPPCWVGQRPSGIFLSAKEAMAEARLTIEWMRDTSKTSGHRADVDAPLRNWRPIGFAEHALIAHLLRHEVKGRAAILEHVEALEVMQVDRYSLMLRSRALLSDVKDIDATSPRLNHAIVAEGFYDDVIEEGGGLVRIASLVRIALHARGGKLSELEIYKENGKPILLDPYEIDLSRVHFY